MTPMPARPERPRISCVVPAYNEAPNLPALLTQLRDVLAQLTDGWEIIVVDDGSRDDTALVILPWTREPGVRYLRLSRNFGKECALTAGIDHAAGDVVVLIDADLQHPPGMIARMLAAWRDGADMVCTARRSRADERVVKRLGTKVFYWLVNRNPAIDIPVDAGDFRLMDRAVVEALRSLPERNRFMKGLYAWVGFRTEVIEYMPGERLAGESSFSLRSLARLAFTGVTAFTNFPLRLWSGVGAVVALGAIGYGLVIVVDHFVHGSDVAGWPTIVTSLMFFSGVQLISIGILGEYVGRIFDEVKQRPIYLVGSESGCATFDVVAQPHAADAKVRPLMRTQRR
jgi:glycosyltransferase involved in cell wall biosynthesis